MLSALGRLWARHERIGQCVAAGTICGTGDAICQSFEILVYDRSPETANTSNFKLFKEGFALKRWAAVSMFGFCVTGPIGSVWYPFLERFVRTRFPHFEPGSWRFIGTKFTMEQLIYGPVVTALFFPCVSLVEGGDSLKTLGKRMKADFLPTLAFDELMWTFVAPCTFKFIPVNRQLMFNSSVSTIENMVLSFIQHRGFPDLPFFSSSSKDVAAVLGSDADAVVNSSSCGTDAALRSVSAVVSGSGYVASQFKGDQDGYLDAAGHIHHNHPHAHVPSHRLDVTLAAAHGHSAHDHLHPHSDEQCPPTTTHGHNTDTSLISNPSSDSISSTTSPSIRVDSHDSDNHDSDNHGSSNTKTSSSSRNIT